MKVSLLLALYLFFATAVQAQTRRSSPCVSIFTALLAHPLTIQEQTEATDEAIDSINRFRLDYLQEIAPNPSLEIVSSSSSSIKPLWKKVGERIRGLEIHSEHLKLFPTQKLFIFGLHLKGVDAIARFNEQSSFAKVKAVTRLEQKKAGFWRYDSSRFKLNQPQLEMLMTAGLASPETFHLRRGHIFLDLDQLIYINPVTEQPEYFLFARIFER